MEKSKGVILLYYSAFSASTSSGGTDSKYLDTTVIGDIGCQKKKKEKNFHVGFIIRSPNVCVFSSRSFWTQEEGHTGFLARRIRSFLSLVDREVEFCVLMKSNFV